MTSPPRDSTPVAIPIGEPVDLVVLACKTNALRCRLLGTSHAITLRTPVREEVPGAIVTVLPAKQWTHARHPYLSGKVLSMRVDVRALGLVPLALHDQGMWDPGMQHWGDGEQPVEEWAAPMIARGRRPQFEMEQVIPGTTPGHDDEDPDPILEASERYAAGDSLGGHTILMNLLAQDLRCLDAHAHLGNRVFHHFPAWAFHHYEVGMGIGLLSLGKDFDGVLPWGLVNNRPFLRCAQGAGLCAWRMGDVKLARAIVQKLLWMNPADNQGARFNLAALDAGRTWEEAEGNGK